MLGYDLEDASLMTRLQNHVRVALYELDILFAQGRWQVRDYHRAVLMLQSQPARLAHPVDNGKCCHLRRLWLEEIRELDATSKWRCPSHDRARDIYLASYGDQIHEPFDHGHMLLEVGLW